MVAKLTMVSCVGVVQADFDGLGAAEALGVAALESEGVTVTLCTARLFTDVDEGREDQMGIDGIDIDG